MAVTVRRLRPTPVPYDRDREDITWVGLSDIKWSLLQQAARRSGIAAAVEVAGEMEIQVRHAQRLRVDADVRDARHDFDGGAA